MVLSRSLWDWLDWKTFRVSSGDQRDWVSCGWCTFRLTRLYVIVRLKRNKTVCIIVLASWGTQFIWFLWTVTELMTLRSWARRGVSNLNTWSNVTVIYFTAFNLKFIELYSKCTMVKNMCFNKKMERKFCLASWHPFIVFFWYWWATSLHCFYKCVRSCYGDHTCQCSRVCAGTFLSSMFRLCKSPASRREISRD